MTYGICPECEQGKHGNCNGEAWDDVKDKPMDCLCVCQRKKERMTNPQGHVWSSSFERRGDENRMITVCLQHPDAPALATYDWPTKEELIAHEKEHEEALPKDPTVEPDEQGKSSGTPENQV